VEGSMDDRPLGRFKVAKKSAPATVAVAMDSAFAHA